MLITGYSMTTGWATGLSAGEGEGNMDFAFFQVTIDLTDAGHG